MRELPTWKTPISRGGSYNLRKKKNMSANIGVYHSRHVFRAHFLLPFHIMSLLQLASRWRRSLNGDTHLLASSPQTGTGQGPQRVWIWIGMECISQRPPTVPSPPPELSNHCLNGSPKQLRRQNGAKMRKLSETHTLPERFCLRGFHGVRLET